MADYDAEYADTMAATLVKLDDISQCLQSAAKCFDSELSDYENKLRANQIDILMKRANELVAELNHTHSMWLGNRALRYRESR